ncbi:hypothetical protein ACX4M5_02150 [Roseomonas mucosa]|uniref:hypothetical protein n=1 Tax=Roseomonas TaxID=125216 RepID=UPI001867B2FC|nr:MULTISPECIES: hypothetical protein [Roseomonas]MCG7354502.1 hypothetical protein [Roseomonas mucosa]
MPAQRRSPPAPGRTEADQRLQLGGSDLNGQSAARHDTGEVDLSLAREHGRHPPAG